MRVVDDRLAHILNPGAVFFARRMELRNLEHFGRRADEYTRRDYYDAMIYLDGEGTHPVLNRHDRIQYDDVRPGWLYLWRPQDRRAVLPRYGPEGAEIIQVGFSPADWGSFAALMGVDPARITSPERVAVALGADTAVRAAFERAVHAADTAATMLELARFWCEIVPRLLEPSGVPGRAAGAPDWLVRSVEAMNDEDNLRAGAPRLRELAHISERQFARATRRYYGTTPSGLVADLRLRQARRLLSATFDSIGAISARCGFASPKYFSDRFTRAFSLSPREYRRRSLAGFPFSGDL